MVPRVLFSGLVDDAALFPPGDVPMDRALAEHAEHRAAPYADLIGPFLCPASRVEELRSTLPDDRSLALGLVFDVTGESAHEVFRAVGSDGRLALVAVEAAYARLGEHAATIGANVARHSGVTGYLEVPRTDFGDALDLVREGSWGGAKFRTGGTDAAAFPSEAEVAAFLVAAAGRGVSFKLTAGLHDAVRHRAADTGWEHHGLLNVLVATRAAARGRGPDEVAAVLAERDGARLAAAVRDWDEDACLDVRRAFRSFGCCGVTDPIHDLEALGLVEGVR